MFVRAVTLAGGLAGAAGLSQFPEFSQQYVQRMGGAVDELSRFVAEFDADAEKLGLSREAALVELAQGGQMGAERAQSMARTITRHRDLSQSLETLQAAGPFTRAYYARRFTDTEIAGRAWQDFKPAVPLTFEGAVFAGAGFLLGLGVVGTLIWLLRLPFGRRRSA